MEPSIQALFLVAIGVSFLTNAYLGLKQGRVRAGSRGLKPYVPSRDAQPGQYWLAMAFFTAVGAVALLLGLLVASGLVAF